MTIRELSQYAALLLSSLSLLLAFMGIVMRPKQRWLLAVVVFYVSLDVVFYVLVLVFHLRSLGSELSPYRVVMQNAILLATLYSYLHGDLAGLVRRWISL